jgi:hypothetical protein
MKSFLDNGQRFILYTYSRSLNVPDGVECRDASQLIGPEGYFTYGAGAGAGRGSHALFSNLFRYKLLAEHGGWWVDTDVVCMSREIPQVEIFAAYENTGKINNAVLRLPKGHSVAQEAFHKAQEVGEHATWGQCGPLLLTALLEAHGLTHIAQPMTACYPIHYSEALDVLRPSHTDVTRERVRGALFLHLWNEIFRREQVDKSKSPPQGSLLREIFDRHPVDGWNGEHDRDHFEQVTTKEALQALATERDRIRSLEREFEAYRQKVQVMTEETLQALAIERDRIGSLEKDLEGYRNSEVVFASLLAANALHRHVPWLLAFGRGSLRRGWRAYKRLMGVAAHRHPTLARRVQRLWHCTTGAYHQRHRVSDGHIEEQEGRG